MKADHENGRPFILKGGRHGCLMLHGFTGTPGHLRYLGERIQQAGYTVNAPLLPGHGTTVEEMNQVPGSRWLAAARTEYSRMRAKLDKVTVIGLSLGGTLSVILAEEYPVDGLIAMAPAIKLRNQFAWASPIVRFVKPYVGGDGGPAADQDVLRDYDCSYDSLPTRRVGDLSRLMRLARSNLFAVVAPTLIIQSEADGTVNPEGAKLLHSGISSEEKQLMWLKQSGHVLTIGPEREQVADAIIAHLHRIDDTKSLAI